MGGGARLKRFTATGDIATGGLAVAIRGFIVSPGTAITTVTLKEGGSAGTIVWQGVFAANASPVAFPLEFSITDPHITIAGAAAEASVAL